MYVLEFIVLEILLVYWLCRTLKYNQPKKDSAYSYRVFVGSIGAATIGILLLIWFVTNQKSFLTELWISITE